MFSTSGPPATWRGDACFGSRGSASQTAKSVTGVVKFVSPVRKQKSTASAGLPATTCACERAELSVSFGALTLRLESHLSIVRNDLTVTAATCAAVAGR